MKLLIIGASGFIGSHLAQEAIKNGHDVFALTRNDTWVAPQKIYPIVGDLENIPWSNIKKLKIDALANMAWITTPGVYHNSLKNAFFLKHNIELISKLTEYDNELYYLGIGSCSEYLQAAVPYYAHCKILLNKFWTVTQNQFNLPGAWARIFSPYGLHEPQKKLSSSIIQNCLNHKSTYLQNPDAIYDFIHVQDIAKALLAILEAQGQGNWDIGTGTGTSVYEFAKKIYSILNVGKLLAKPTKQAQNLSLVAQNKNLIDLGWRPQEDFEASILKIKAYIQANND